MSVIRCDRCHDFIDSDEDPGCFVEVPWLNLDERVWCESCREEEFDEWEEEQSIRSKAESEWEDRNVDH